MSVVDLKTRKIIWQRPFGTAEENGPLGIKTRLKVPIGVPTLSGSVTTKSGLIFFAGTQDYYLRAMDLHTGKELWRARLPVDAKSTPMTCVSPTSGRQYVVATAGGARLSPDRATT